MKALAVATAAGLIVVGMTTWLRGQQPSLGYDDTPMQPNGKWHIHDGKRPQPRIVTPSPAPIDPIAAPTDATMLVGGGDDVSAWQTIDGGPVPWAMKDGVLQTGKGMIRTKAEFTDF